MMFMQINIIDAVRSVNINTADMLVLRHLSAINGVLSLTAGNLQ